MPLYVARKRSRSDAKISATTFSSMNPKRGVTNDATEVEVTLNGSRTAYLVDLSCSNVATHWRRKVTASCRQSSR